MARRGAPPRSKAAPDTAARDAASADRVTGPDAFAARFAVSPGTLAKLEAYADLLRQWQKAVNLVAPRTLDDLWHRHLADSAQLVPLIPAAARRIVDLGSGGGFPGLVLAILLAETRAHVRVTLVESDQRKVAFLREVARRTATPVEILSIRIEDAATQLKLDSADVVTARALAPLSRLLGLAAPLLAGGAIAIFPKGREAGSEIEAARSVWGFDAELVDSLTEPDARIVVVRSLASKREGIP